MVSLGIVQADNKEMVSEELYMSVDALIRKNKITTDNIMVHNYVNQQYGDSPKKPSTLQRLLG